MGPFFIWTGIILLLPLIHHNPSTTVILLENDSPHNAVVVATEAGELTVDRPYTYTTLNAPDRPPEALRQTDPQTLQKQYGELFDTLPPKPVSILFYFDQGSSEPTPESRSQIPELIELIASHQPAVVDIIGHSDRAGNDADNYRLALERARYLERYLEEHHVVLEHKRVVSYGESDPLIPTDDGVSEPKNRRVEVIVR